MEIAIPLIALGGMYIVSNQSNENCSKNEIRQSRREKFTNMGIRSNLGVKTDNYLPNTNIPPQNYPVSNISQLVDTVQKYPNPNVATDKYFNQDLYQKNVSNNVQVGQNPKDVYSLTGNYYAVRLLGAAHVERRRGTHGQHPELEQHARLVPVNVLVGNF